MKLSGKVAIVTGASRGIGRAVALGLAKQGASVLLIARSLAPLEKAAAEIRAAGGKGLAFPGDVSEERTLPAAVEAAARSFGPVDVLVNNAGLLTPRAPVSRVAVADWDRSIAVNLRSAFLGIRAALPGMLERGRGSIINVSSGAGKREAPEWGPYAVAKAGIEALTKLAAAEVRESGVRINAVNPGGVRTAMRAQAYPDEDPKLLPAPEQLVPLFVWLASEQCRVTGESIDWKSWNK